jgi:acetyl-CoA C-acetyltransferase
MNTHMIDPWLNKHKPEIYWPMLQTAETGGQALQHPRERRTATAPQSQQKAAPRRPAGRFATRSCRSP